MVKVVISACTLAMCIYTGNMLLVAYGFIFQSECTISGMSLKCVIPKLKHDLTC